MIQLLCILRIFPISKAFAPHKTHSNFALFYVPMPTNVNNNYSFNREMLISIFVFDIIHPRIPSFHIQLMIVAMFHYPWNNLFLPFITITKLFSRHEHGCITNQLLICKIKYCLSPLHSSLFNQ